MTIYTVMSNRKDRAAIAQETVLVRPRAGVEPVVKPAVFDVAIGVAMHGVFAAMRVDADGRNVIGATDGRERVMSQAIDLRDRDRQDRAVRILVNLALHEAILEAEGTELCLEGNECAR